MFKLGWHCCGSLPVSASPSSLKSRKKQIEQADLVIVNGEGSLHHNSRNATYLKHILSQLIDHKPIALINALWQENDPETWSDILPRLKAVFVRDKQSQQEISNYVEAQFAPDLTFYHYPNMQHLQRAENASGARFAITDSVKNDWTNLALAYIREQRDTDLLTLFTGEIAYSRGWKDRFKKLKYQLYPTLAKNTPLKVPPRYRAIAFAKRDTHDFLKQMVSYQAVGIARYHALCFAIQQETPFVAIASNSHKSEALIREIGLPEAVFMMSASELKDMPIKLQAAINAYPEYRSLIRAYKKQATQQITHMFSVITDE